MMVAPPGSIKSLDPIPHDVGHSSSHPEAGGHSQQVALCKEWPSDNLPRFGGPKPTRPTDPEVARDWPAGTCYFCHLNVKKGKEGYSIVHSLGGKVFCHKVCGAKARKVRQAQQLSSGGSPSKEQHVAHALLQDQAAPETPPAKRSGACTPEPASPTMAFPPYSPSTSFLPLKKRMAAAAAASGWNSQRSSSLSSSPAAVKRERHSQSHTTDDKQDSREDTATPPAKVNRPNNLGKLEIPRNAEAMASQAAEPPKDGQSRASTATDVEEREEPSTPLDDTRARAGPAEPEDAATSEGLVNLEDHIADRPKGADWLRKRREARADGIDSRKEANAASETATSSPEPHHHLHVPSEGHGIRSKRKPARSKWGNIAGMLRLGEQGEP